MNRFKNKYFLLYLLCWGILLILGGLVEDKSNFETMFVSTAVLALVAPLLLLVCNKVGADAPAGKTYKVHSMEDGSVVCRVEGVWIYRGMEEKATWYLRGRKVYSFAEKEYLYRMDADKLYRRGEEQPCMLVENDTIYSLPDNVPLYQTAE